MGHLSQDELAKLVHEAEQKVEVGAVYAHYKHPDDNYYVVTAIALIESTDEPAVVYQAQYGARVTFVPTRKRLVRVYCMAGPDRAAFCKS